MMLAMKVQPHCTRYAHVPRILSASPVQPQKKVNYFQIFSEAYSWPKFGPFLEDRHSVYDSSIGAMDKT